MVTVLQHEAAGLELALSVGVFCEGTELLDGICAALEAGGLAGAHSCGDLAETLAACEKHDLDVVVIGARRSDRATLEAVTSLGEAFPDVRVLVVCERSAAGDVRKALEAGARGVVLANEVEGVLLPVLRVVCAGQVSVPGVRGQEIERRILTTREKQVLALVVQGMTNAEIASRLFLATSTVKSHLSSAFAKLGVASRNEAAALIADRGRNGSGMLGVWTDPPKLPD